MSLGFAARVVAVGLAGSIVATLPAIALVVPAIAEDYRLDSAVKYLSISAAGNFVIGVPIALVVFAILRSSGELHFKRLLVAANVVGGGFLLTTALAGPFGLFFFGLPMILSANAIAIFGWFWIVRPTVRQARNGRA